MAVPFKVIQTYGAAVAQSTREDIFKNTAPWAKAAGDEVIVIEKLGFYGAVTATYGLYKGSDVIAEEGNACETTSFGGDWYKVPDAYITLLPGQELRCFMTDSAGDPAGLVVCAKGAKFKVNEL